MNLRFAMAAGLVAVGLQFSASAEDWSRFRGPNGSGVSTDSIPAKWTSANTKWKVQLPGSGHSSPIIIGHRLYVTCASDDASHRMLLCLNAADGKIHWQKDFPTDGYKHHNDNSFAASTPAADADHVYIAWVSPLSYLLIALDHNGNQVWSLDLGPYKSQHMNSASPIVHDDLVILPNDQDGASFVVAVDRNTGKVRWKTPRNTKIAASATPCIYQPPGASPQVVLSSTAEGLTGYDLKTGEAIWSMPDLFGSDRVVASPIVCGDLIVGNAGQGPGGKMLAAVRPALTKDQKPQLAWKLVPKTPYVPTPIAKGNLLFLWSDTGTVTCLKGLTGEEIWSEKLGGGFYCSPVIAGDKLFGTSKKGEVFILSASDKYQLLGRNALDELCHSTPAIAGGRMYIHTQNQLFCIGE